AFVGGRGTLVGAQSTGMLRRAIDAEWQERQAEAGAGGACGPQGCPTRASRGHQREAVAVGASGACAGAFSAQECANFFTHCGYPATPTSKAVQISIRDIFEVGVAY